MYIQEVFIKHFRNLSDIDLLFHRQYNIIHGQNAQGKTNLVEALYYLSCAKSHRENAFVNLIHYDKEFALIRGVINKHNTNSKIEILLEKNGKRKIKIDENNTPASMLYDEFAAVIFYPDDLRIIKDGPEKRRRYLDVSISKINKNYKKALREYYRLLKHRNYLLLEQKKGYEELLEIFDEQVALFGAYITKKRVQYLAEIQQNIQKIHNEIAGGNEQISIRYQSIVLEKNTNTEELEQCYKMLLKEHFKEDSYRKITTQGIHKDDFHVFINGRFAKQFGSQGQQKTAAIALKLSEIELYEAHNGTRPIVLLDDVLSELDEQRQTRLLQMLYKTQVFITATADEVKKEFHKTEYALFHIQEGKVNQTVQ